MKRLYESILGNLDSGIEDYVEISDRMAKDLTWVKHIKLDDAVYYEAALYSITYKAFARAQKMSDDERRAFGLFLLNTVSPWDCYNWEEAENWEQREYTEAEPNKLNGIKGLDLPNVPGTDYRWSKPGSNSFFNFFWDADNTYSLDQEDLLKHRYTLRYIKQLQKIAQKYGLELKPIF